MLAFTFRIASIEPFEVDTLLRAAELAEENEVVYGLAGGISTLEGR